MLSIWLAVCCSRRGLLVGNGLLSVVLNGTGLFVWLWSSEREFRALWVDREVRWR